jgi:outer membrane receptor for ferric coprogen and ferric-rhodotorulic acid
LLASTISGLCAATALVAATSIHAQEGIKTMPTVRVEGLRDQTTEDSYTTDATRTATGLTLSLRETPQSVSIVTRERMDDQLMQTAADALKSTTGVSLKAVDRGRNNLTVRGFEVRSFQFDGVPVATGNVGIETTNTAIYDRIEVVRGATGLITGAGEPSAAINLVRKHALSDEFTASVSTELGSWERVGAGVDVSTPLNGSGSVRARFVADAARQDAFIDLEETQNTVIYAIVDADLGENTRLSVGASDQRDERDGVLWAGLPYWYSDGTRTDWSRSQTTATEWNEWDTRERTVFAALDHTFANLWSLQVDATHYRQREDSKLLWMWGDPDAVTGEGMEAYPYHYLSEPKQTNASLIVTGPFRAWGREHEITFGFMHSERDEGWTNRDAISDLAPLGSLFDWDGSYPEPELGERYVGSQTAVTQSGLYSATRLQLADRLKVIVGGRFSNWKQEDEVGAWTAEAFEIEHEGVFTPYAGVLYDLGTNFTAYVSYTDIFTPNTNKDRNGEYLDPAEGASYEAGLKGEFFEGGLNASLGLFLIDQNNYPEIDAGFFVPGTLDPAYRPAQGTKTEGYELEVVGALTPQWKLALGWTHYRAQDAEDQDVAVDHPRRLLKLFTKYELQGVLRGLSLGGGVEWESATPARAINPGTGLEERVGMGSYALVDLMAEYRVRENFRLQLNLNNALDEEYRSTSYWWGSPYTYGEPRNIVVSLAYDW